MEFVGLRSAFSEGEIKVRKPGIRYLPPASVCMGREWRSVSLRDHRESARDPTQCATHIRRPICTLTFAFVEEVCILTDKGNLTLVQMLNVLCV